MVVTGRPARHRASRRPRPETARRAGPGRVLLPASVVTLCAAAGLLVVAAADTAGREGYAATSWANHVYWLGQALIICPVAARLVSPRVLAAAEALTIAAVPTLAEYLVKVCYSPAAFTFPDELEHWRSTVNLLHTGRLFTPNYMLPISPQYPGLEEATSAVSSVSGLSVFVSGLIVAGAAHLLFVCILYLLFRQISRSDRIAALGVLIYSSNPDLAAFDSMFVYQTLAVAFLALALLAAWRTSTYKAHGGRTGWLAVALLAVAVTVITHHVTALALVVMLISLTVVTLIAGYRRSAGWLGLVAAASAAALALWITFVARGTIGYLAPAGDGVLQAVHRLLAGIHSAHAPAPATPLSNEVLAAADVLAVSVLVPVGWIAIRRDHRHQPWTVAMAIGAASWYLVVAVRLAVADGSELAGRAATFVFVPLALTAAVGLKHLISLGFRRWRVPVVVIGALASVLILLFDGLANGWPPYWERLPGTYQAAGDERSVSPQGIAAAQWALAALGPDNRFAADVGNEPLLGAYGDQNPVGDVAYLYTSATFTLIDDARAVQQALRYVLVDTRLSGSLPVSGRYFPVDPNTDRYTHPLPLAYLTKFSRSPGVARIYDAGDIVIYKLPGF